MEHTNALDASRISVERSSFTWTIQNFKNVTKSEECINSQEFIFEAGRSFGKAKNWRVFLRTSTETEEISKGKLRHTKWIGCFITLLGDLADADKILESSSIEDAYAVLRLNILKGSGAQFVRRNGVLRNFLDKEFGWTKILRQNARLDTLLPSDNSLTLSMEFDLYDKPVPTESVASLENRYRAVFLKRCKPDVSGQLISPHHLPCPDAPAKIISKDGDEFRVSRGVLSGGSPVFERMFQTRMTESESGIVRIVDLSSRAICLILHFMCSGELGKDWREPAVLPELVYAAEKYQLSDLLEFFNKTIGRVCSRENATVLIKLAKKLSLETAEKELLEFIKSSITTYDDVIYFSKNSP